MTETKEYRPTKARINLQAITTNIKRLQSYLPETTAIIAVVKADGYGHGETEVARAAIRAGAIMLAVATPDEAIRLRVAGIEADILVMGPSPAEFAGEAQSKNITITVSNVEWLQAASSYINNQAKKLKIHVKIDSGMGRIGLKRVEELDAILQFVAQLTVVEIDGVFTHFARADEKEDMTTKLQYGRFQSFIHHFPSKPRLIHASNSAATLLYPQYALDAVRFGIGLYGIPPSPYVATVLPFPLEKAMKLETELAYVKKMQAGEPISYGGTYITTADEWIGTLPIGYADGLRRGLKGQEVLIDGQRVPIVGTICMDQCMVKLPYELPIGEPVVLVGRQGNEEVTMEEWAERLDTIPYETVVSITKRVPRVYSPIPDIDLVVKYT